MLDHSLARRAPRKRRPPRPRNGSVQMIGPLLQVTDYDDPIALEHGLRSYFMERRPVSVDGLGNRYPETVVFEVLQVGARLYYESRRYTDHRKVSKRDAILTGGLAYLANELGRDDDYAGHRDAVERFATYYKHLRTELFALPATATYAQNATFWREAGRLVVRLAVAKDNPIEPASVVRSVVHSVKELPTTLSKTAEAVSRAALIPVNEIGDKLKAIAIPVAIGGGALLGLVLLSRSSDHQERAS